MGRHRPREVRGDGRHLERRYAPAHAHRVHRSALLQGELHDLAAHGVRIVVERLFARPGKLSSAKANFELGRCMGELETMLSMCGIPFQEVTPQTWQKEFGVSGDKQTHIDCAKRLFPGVSLKRSEKCVKDFDGYADALLMAEYARRHMA